MSLQCVKTDVVYLPYDVECGEVDTLKTNLAIQRTSTQNSPIAKVVGNIGVNYGVHFGVAGSRTQGFKTNSTMDNRTIEVSNSPQLLNGFKPISFTNGGQRPIIGYNLYNAEINFETMFGEDEMERKRLCESSICGYVTGELQGTWELVRVPNEYIEENIINDIACPYKVQACRILSGLFLERDSIVERVDEPQKYVVDVCINHIMSHLEAFKKFVHSKQYWDIGHPHWIT